MDIEIILKLTQIAFFALSGTIIVLTYLKAKDGLLNTINTEYQKKALLKVEEISNYLISEFDIESEYHWSKQMIMDDCVKKMLENLEKNKEFIKKEKKWMLGVPGNPMTRRLDNWVKKVKSDPFVPKAIRSMVVDYLEDRVQKMIGIHIAELRNFGDTLAKNPDSIIDNDQTAAVIHNKINDAQLLLMR